MALRVSFTRNALEWLASRKGAVVVIDLVYRRGRCTSAFCTMVPSIEVYAERRRGRYEFETVRSEEGVTVHVARPLLEASARRDVHAVIDRRLLGGLRVRGLDPYDLGL